jgi:hypothetical protein
MRCNNGAGTPLHFPVSAMPREIRSTTEPGQDRAVWGILVVDISRAAPL